MITELREWFDEAKRTSAIATTDLEEIQAQQRKTQLDLMTTRAELRSLREKLPQDMVAMARTEIEAVLRQYAIPMAEPSQRGSTPLAPPLASPLSRLSHNPDVESRTMTTTSSSESSHHESTSAYPTMSSSAGVHSHVSFAGATSDQRSPGRNVTPPATSASLPPSRTPQQTSAGLGLSTLSTLTTLPTSYISAASHLRQESPSLLSAHSLSGPTHSPQQASVPHLQHQTTVDVGGVDDSISQMRISPKPRRSGAGDSVSGR